MGWDYWVGDVRREAFALDWVEGSTKSGGGGGGGSGSGDEKLMAGLDCGGDIVGTCATVRHSATPCFASSSRLPHFPTLLETNRPAHKPHFSYTPAVQMSPSTLIRIPRGEEQGQGCILVHSTSTSTTQLLSLTLKATEGERAFETKCV